MVATARKYIKSACKGHARGYVRLLLLLVLGVFLVFNVQPVFADPQADVDSIINGTPFYDPTSEGSGTTSSCVTNGVNTNAGQPGSVYFVGDSIGTQIQAGLGTALGGLFKANALSGRNLSTSPPMPDGIDAVNQDQTYVKGASTVVIELGTNAGGFTTEAVGQIITNIRSYAPNAAIYWVDTAVVQRPDYAKTLDGVNSIIYSQSTTLNYKVLSWNKAVFGSSADPQNISPTAPDNGYIRHADEFVHLTDQGINAMIGLISQGVKNGGAACGGCTTNITPDKRPETVWNYFIGKGLKAYQVAAMMGNMQAEAGFNPKRVEGGWGFPAEMDTIPPNVGPQGQPGYGIVQWTSPGRKEGLANFAQSQNGPVTDLCIQLGFEWSELQGNYKGVFAALQQSNDIGTANSIFGHQYEGFGTNTEGLRLGFANDWLLKFGSGTPSS